MAKISLTKPVSGYNLAAINDNFTALEAEFQDKVLYRDNPVGEPNSLEQDLDLNGNDILNAGTLNGVPIADLSDISAYVDSAAASAASAAASYDSFDDRYLGSKAVAPTLDNDGNALITGALYWDSVGGQQYTWNGSAWVANSVPGGVVAIASGGTGATTAANARTALGNTPTNIGAASSGAIVSSGLTQSTARILGRTTGSTGAIEELSAGSALTLSAGSLDVAAAGITPAKLSGAQSGTAPVYGLRAWCVFNGGTAGTNAPTAGGNVTSVQRVSAGTYTVNFTTALPDANFAASVLFSIATSANQLANITGQTASSFSFEVKQPGVGNYDVNSVFVMITR